MPCSLACASRALKIAIALDFIMSAYSTVKSSPIQLDITTQQYVVAAGISGTMVVTTHN
jgi:hypothetical protein